MYSAQNLSPNLRDTEILCRLHPCRQIDATDLVIDLGCSRKDITESFTALRARGFGINMRDHRYITIDWNSYERAEAVGVQHIDDMLAREVLLA